MQGKIDAAKKQNETLSEQYKNLKAQATEEQAVKTEESTTKADDYDKTNLDIFKANFVFLPSLTSKSFLLIVPPSS